MKSNIEEIQELIKEIESLKREDTNSEKFKKWKERCKLILSIVFGKESDELEQFKKIRFHGYAFTSDEYRNREIAKEALNQGLINAKVKLETMIDKLNYDQQLKEDENKKNNNIDKIFISHASDDREYTDLVVELLHNIGIEKNSGKIFYSSKNGYGIPLKENIYDYLKGELNKNILVIFALSDNYYRSVPCLNEMGATWVNSNAYFTLLLPFFKFKEIKGAIDPMKISFKITEKYRLDEFKDAIIKMFNLKPIDSVIWQQDRDKFLCEINNLMKRDENKYSSHTEEIKSVRKGNNCDIEVDVMISNLGEKNVLCQDMVFELLDSNDNQIKIQVEDEQLDNLIIYSGERRKITFELTNSKSKFNPRRYKNGKVDAYWATI